jgi:hypothetical protein
LRSLSAVGEQPFYNNLTGRGKSAFSP